MNCSQAHAQIKDSTAAHVSSAAKKDSVAKPEAVVDTVKKIEIIDTVVKKNCYNEYYDIMRSKGANKVTDGMQKVVIAFKTEGSCNCLMGEIELVGGKIKPPLFVQEQNGEYTPITSVVKKLDAAFSSCKSSS